MIQVRHGIIGSMAFHTAEGTAFLSYGELVALSTGLGSSRAAGLADVFHGERLPNLEAQAALEAARADANGNAQVHSIIDRGMDRLEAAA